MKIFYVKLDADNVKVLSRPERKKLQSSTGKKLVDYVAETFYGIKDRAITVVNNKPVFENSNLHFSISHSNEIVAAAFDDYPVGLDVEFMKDRDYKKFVGHYKISATDKAGFYRQWTELEAKIKLQAEPKQSYSTELENDYMLTVLSTAPDKLNPEIVAVK